VAAAEATLAQPTEYPRGSQPACEVELPVDVPAALRTTRGGRRMSTASDTVSGTPTPNASDVAGSGPIGKSAAKNDSMRVVSPKMKPKLASPSRLSPTVPGFDESTNVKPLPNSAPAESRQPAPGLPEKPTKVPAKPQKLRPVLLKSCERLALPPTSLAASKRGTWPRKVFASAGNRCVPPRWPRRPLSVNKSDDTASGAGRAPLPRGRCGRMKI